MNEHPPTPHLHVDRTDAGLRIQTRVPGPLRRLRTAGWLAILVVAFPPLVGDMVTWGWIKLVALGVAIALSIRWDQLVLSEELVHIRDEVVVWGPQVVEFRHRGRRWRVPVDDITRIEVEDLGIQVPVRHWRQLGFGLLDMGDFPHWSLFRLRVRTVDSQRDGEQVWFRSSSESRVRWIAAALERERRQRSDRRAVA